ncbi:hypothetical protein L873DRAFT_1813235 [Choiromyces venosus 120613-1]|uniref:Uncharacterized protein n=1 Tax=Choiromyces venosus 120613-1 TaxID=1336337 RepID=A0A3N4JFV3_9PEZI|nr:hypothetical protein L873DRAFT_1813235 [Choiromyces venosus 120613-1]
MSYRKLVREFASPVTPIPCGGLLFCSDVMTLKKIEAKVDQSEQKLAKKKLPNRAKA